MSVVSTVEAVPSRIRAVVRVVGELNSATRDEILRCLMPGTDNDDMAVKCLNETRGLGLIELDGQEIRLAAGVKKADLSDAKIDGFLSEWCERVLLQEDASRSSSDGNVARAIAWFLCQTPLMTYGWNEHHLASWLTLCSDKEHYDLTNESRFANLFYWCRYLGYAVSFEHKGLCAIPEPSSAIFRRISDIFDGEKRLPIAQFETRMGRILPVLETGSIRQLVEARFTRPRDANTFSLSTSLAIHRLEEVGVLSLESLSDAERRVLPTFSRDPRQVTHVTFAKRGAR